MSLIIFGVIALLSLIASFVVVGVKTKSEPNTFSAVASETGEMVLIGTTSLSWFWFKAVNVTTIDDLGYKQIEVWLAEEEVTFTELISEPEALTDYASYRNLYAYQNSTFSFDFYNVMGPPGYTVTLNIQELGKVNHLVNNSVTFGGVDIKHKEYHWTVAESGYYDIQFVVGNGVSGTVSENLEIVTLNYTFYNSSSKSCILDSSNRACALPDLSPISPHSGKQYIIAFIPPWLAPTFETLPKSRDELYIPCAILLSLAVVVFVIALIGFCYCYYRVRRPPMAPQREYM